MNKLLKKICSTTLAMAVLAPLQAIEACTTVIVGKGATVDGSTMIARNEDMGTSWPKYFVVRPAGKNKSTKYVSKGNGFSMTIPEERYKMTATPEWDESEGTFDEAGINEKGVAMSGTESLEANKKVLEVDPLVKKGIGEDSMNSVVLPYIKSAREGVERLGKIVEKYGAAEGNGVIFSDKDEVWYMEIGTGHQWVAQRIPDDSYAVIANQIVIEEVDLDDKDNFLGSKDLIETAKKAGTYKEGEKFNFEKAYGTNTDADKQYNYPRVWYGQKLLTPSKEQDLKSYDFPFVLKADKKIGTADIEKVLTSHFEGTEYDYQVNKESQLRPASVPQTMESHILQIRPNMPADLAGVHWLSLGVPETSVYVPFYSGITDTPKAYKTGTDNPADDGAYWTFRRVNAIVSAHFDPFKKKYVQPVQEKAREELAKDLAETDKEALKIKDKEKRAKFLTEASEKRADKMLKKWDKLSNKLMKALADETTVYHNPDL
ncbi:hypothetical protein D3H64_03525 [Atopobacter sp. AH10]|uniref:C69 family dipeptidase n=1 Tax=Atopobacter sp. AH10 TaxID=2315861 RepID=UPI000EF1A888|nr:C69 family dipeptidase [Atopobacter sp. AH10]RLK63686.1 hypothetical protein D3H64_03525 [Atopobacter sp. AH10]